LWVKNGIAQKMMLKVSHRISKVRKLIFIVASPYGFSLSHPKIQSGMGFIATYPAEQENPRRTYSRLLLAQLPLPNT
jgi:hypothetical protein